MANVQARSEPRKGELLWLQQQQQQRHRSYSLFYDLIQDTPQKAKRWDLKLWGHIESLENEQIHEEVFSYITSASFGGVLLDRALVTELVEMWRSETHTFHFSVGEATITLQDVQFLRGLPIHRPIVSGMWHSMDIDQRIYMCDQLLGSEPQGEINCGKI